MPASVVGFFSAVQNPIPRRNPHPWLPARDRQAPNNLSNSIVWRMAERAEVLESIVIPPKANAPFSLLPQTEWVRTLTDGDTITSENQRRIARDTSGRIYQERWFLVPKNGKNEIADDHYPDLRPQRAHLVQLLHARWHEAMRIKRLFSLHQRGLQLSRPPTGKLPDDTGSVIHEDLGKQLIAGVETTGTCDGVIYNPNVFGNDRKVTIEREFWYSPKLGINLISKRSDPRIGTQTFSPTNLILAEPDPKLFDLPEGFKVVDRRQALPPEN